MTERIMQLVGTALLTVGGVQLGVTDPVVAMGVGFILIAAGSLIEMVVE